MRYCEPRRAVHKFVQWNTLDDLDDIKLLLGYDRVTIRPNEETGLELYYTRGFLDEVHIPRGYIVIAYSGIAGGKDIVHPDIFNKRFSEVIHD